MVSQDSPPNQNSSTLHQFGSQNLAVFPPDLGTFQCHTQLNNNIQFLGEKMVESSTTRHFMDLLGASNDNVNHHHMLSLSLGSCAMFPTPVQCRETSLNQNNNLINPGFINPGIDRYADYSLATPIANSKYLRPARSLLEEVASVGGQDTGPANEKYARRLSRHSKNGSLVLRSSLRVEFPTDELEAKILKLITMLEEVERRYEQYCHHMEELVTSYEAISGKSYTALALEAMSKHFCNLKDAIISQINAIRRRISEESPSTVLSHLSLFQTPDANNSLQRLSLQQFRMIQSSRQTWRPIRGLPETSVAILRTWLFQHFLHPYPNDLEKLMLASQTGLTKNQVSNWFINARVRLWKPMIEEMYKEEFADSSSADESEQNLFGGSSTRISTHGVTHCAEE